MPLRERGFFHSPYEPSQASPTPEHENHEQVTIRPFQESDAPALVALMRRNFNGPAFSLYPRDVVGAYKSANSEADVKHAVRSGGTDVYVAYSPDGQLGGFVLIRYNPNRVPRRNAYGELDLRRLHVDTTLQGKGVGKKLFATVMQRAKEINVEFITTHASGSSRLYFEHNGWTGKTILNDMRKRRTSALVFAAERRVTPANLPLYPTTSHVIYAGSNRAKAERLQEIIGRDVQIINAEEEPSSDVVVAARSKARTGAEHLVVRPGTVPLVVANDIRTDLMVVNPPGDATKYSLLNRGKPRNGNTAEETQINFKLMLDTANITKKPAPYIVRSATYLHNPMDPSADSCTENDVSVWLSQESLQILASDSGFRQYRKEVYNTYGVDISEMSAGFALPIFLSRGYVAGLYAHPYDTLPNRNEIAKRATDLVIGGIDEKLVKERLGMLV